MMGRVIIKGGIERAENGLREGGGWATGRRPNSQAGRSRNG